VSVPVEVSLAAVRAELAAADQYAAAAGLQVDADPVAGGELRFYVTLVNCEFSAGLRKSEAVPLGDPVVPVLDGFVG
jgi:hypothetical protein